MKKTIIFLAAIFAISISSFAQPGKGKQTANNPGASLQDSITVKGSFKTDTVKVTVYYHVTEGETTYLSFKDGYAIVRTFTPEGGQSNPIGQPVYTDKKYAAIKERIKEVVQYNWK